MNSSLFHLLIDFNLNKGKLMNRRTIFLSLLLVLSSISNESFTNAQGGGDTRRRTVAVTYLRDPVKVVFAGTTLRPTARGEATVERWRKRNESEIDITIENMI